MEKVDIRFNGKIARDSPDVRKMIAHKVDERTVFYFSSEEQREKFIEKLKILRRK